MSGKGKKRRQRRQKKAGGRGVSAPSTSSPDESSTASPEQSDDPQQIQLESLLTQVEHYQGPLPHPDDLAKFNELVPGSVDFILEEAAANGKHRRKMESRTVFANTTAFLFSSLSAGLVDLAAVGGGIFLLATDKRLEGFALLIGEIALLRWGHRRKKAD